MKVLEIGGIVIALLFGLPLAFALGVYLLMMAAAILKLVCHMLIWLCDKYLDWSSKLHLGLGEGFFSGEKGN